MYSVKDCKGKCPSCQLLIEYAKPLANEASDATAAPASFYFLLHRILKASVQRERAAYAHSPDYIAGTWASCRKLPGFVLNELQRQGVDGTIPKKVLVRRAKIVWCGPQRFEFAASGRSLWMHEGEQAIIFLVRDAFGRALDIAAWDPKTNRLGSWLGAAVALGQGTVLAPRLSEGLHVHRTPLNWLRAGGQRCRDRRYPQGSWLPD